MKNIIRFDFLMVFREAMRITDAYRRGHLPLIYPCRKCRCLPFCAGNRPILLDISIALQKQMVPYPDEIEESPMTFQISRPYVREAASRLSGELCNKHFIGNFCFLALNGYFSCGECLCGALWWLIYELETYGVTWMDILANTP